MKNPALLISIVLIALSCSKEEQYITHENTTVEGVLLSAADRSPIANGKVLLLSSYNDGSGSAIWHGRGYSTRNVLVTDKDGHFSYSFKHADDTVYAIAAEAEGFFTNFNSGGYPYPKLRATGRASVEKGYFNYYNRASDEKDFRVEKGIVYLPEIRLAPEGWIKFKIINESPAYPDDVMKLGGEGAGGQLTNFTGASVNTQYYRGPLRAGRFSYIGYNVTSQGNFQYYEDSVFLEPHDTAIYELRY